MAEQQKITNKPIVRHDFDLLATKIRAGKAQKERARSRFAHWFIIGYLFLLLSTFIGPTWIYLKAKSADPLKIQDLKDMLQAYSSAFAGAGLTSLLGFVVGYYFKNEERRAIKNMQGKSDIVSKPPRSSSSSINNNKSSKS